MNQLETLRALLNRGQQEDLLKAISSASGFAGINLEPEAALLLPYFAAWRARVPSDNAARGSTQATWKIQLGYGSAASGSWGTAEKGIGPATTPDAIQIQAPYLRQAFNGDVSYDSILTARDQDDPMNIETSNVLALLLMREELIGLSGNNVAIAAPSSITGQVSAIGSPVGTFAAGTWHVKVTAITNEGAFNNASSNSNIGESAPSTSVAIVVPSGGQDFLDISFPAVPGAVGYKFYCEHTAGGGTFYLVDPATGLRYKQVTGTPPVTDLTTLGTKIVVPTGQTFVGVDHVQIYTVPPNTQPVAPSTDGSANALTYEGLFSWCTKTTVYGQTGWNNYNVDLNGSPFTTVGTGLLEVDNVLENQWQNNLMSPSLIMGSPRTIRSMGNAVVKQGNVPTYWVDITQSQGSFQGGTYMGGYTNNYAGQMLPGAKPLIPCWAHPYLPDGLLMMVSEDIPSATYKYSRKGKAFALETLAPYTYWPLAPTDISIPFAIYWMQTLKCYHPSSQSAIVGIRVDQ